MPKKEVPNCFNYNYRKVIDKLINTIRGTATSFSVLKRETKLHDQTLSRIIKDLRGWGFMDENEYKMSKKHHNNIKPHLEKNKKIDNNFHNNWSIIIVLAFSIALFSLVFMWAGNINFKPIQEFKVNVTDDPYFAITCSDFELACQGECKEELFKIIWVNENNEEINSTKCYPNKYLKKE